MSESSTAARSASFHNQVSAGLEYSYEYELDIPLIGNVFDFSFRAHANGKYGHEKISTFSSEVTEDTGVSIDYPSVPQVQTILHIYLYWAKAGYMVVDYQTMPGGTEPWSLYDKPDPAFILPWYGFPDP
jgi:hypothetical protein